METGIVSGEWLERNLRRRDIRIIDARMSFADYEENHIPGAQFLHIETLRMSSGGFPCKMLPAQMLGMIFSRLGIENATPVIIYSNSVPDLFSATYTAWSLLACGARSVRILDGGLKKWREEGRPVTQRYPEIENAPFSELFDESIYADWEYVRANMESPDIQLIDTRTRSLYTGETGPTIRLGHIPGAILHNYVWDFQHDGSYQPIDNLRSRYLGLGITPDKEIITYCITGREGSAVWFVLKHLLRYPRVRLYQASLTEWAAIPDLPLVSGPTPWGNYQPTQRAA